MHTQKPVTDKNAELTSLFEKYGQTKDVSVRNDIVMRSMHIVQYAMVSTRNMFNVLSDGDDAESEAVIALINSVDSFDLAKGVSFRTYASIKVRGAIIDYIRRMDVIPRGIRKFAKEYEKAFSELFTELDREPTSAEIAARLGMTEEKLSSMSLKSAASQTFSLEEMIFEGAEFAEENDSGFYQAENRMMIEERKQQLVNAIKQLKEKERLVITLYYYEHLKYGEIAQVIGVSESRVCQIHTKATEKMRDLLAEYMGR